MGGDRAETMMRKERPGAKRAAIAIGGSAGSTAALIALLECLPEDYPLALIVVTHVHPEHGASRLDVLGRVSNMPVKEAEDKEKILPGRVYLAPPNYHLLIEDDLSFSLSYDEKVRFSRPSIDVLLESAADAFGDRLIGVILGGANDDGARGMRRIRERGGLTIAQDPAGAECPDMPKAAIDSGGAERIMTVSDICDFLSELGRKYKQDDATKGMRLG